MGYVPPLPKTRQICRRLGQLLILSAIDLLSAKGLFISTDPILLRAPDYYRPKSLPAVARRMRNSVPEPIGKHEE